MIVQRQKNLFVPTWLIFTGPVTLFCYSMLSDRVRIHNICLCSYLCKYVIRYVHTYVGIYVRTVMSSMIALNKHF